MRRPGKLLAVPLAFLILTAASRPAFSADYSFESGADTLAGFGGATGYDEPITPDPMGENIRRNKDAAYLPPPYGVFSGDIPTDASSPYHDNNRESGFTAAGQDLPPSGGEDYAPGVNEASINRLPSTSQLSTQNTAPLYYGGGSVGTLYVHSTGKTIKVFEGESAENMARGAAHFSGTSAWDGNVAMASHNRGSSAYFAFLKDLAIGSRLTYTTSYGSRIYEVYLKDTISEADYTALSWAAENILTLITCVADMPELRVLVQAREV